MENIEVNQSVRGVIEMDEATLSELNLLKKEIFAKGASKEESMKEFERYAQLLTSGMPKIYWDITWEDFIGDAKAKKLVQQYCEKLKEAFEYGQGIIFCGKHGTGKTALSTFVMKSALEQGFTVKFVSVAKIIDMIMKSFDDRVYRDNMLTMIERIELLVLDDLGKEYLGAKKQLNPLVQLTFDAMLRERVNHRLITIASTNFAPQVVKDQYGDSVFSILYSVGKFVNVTGEDFRIIKSKKFWEALES